MGNTLIRSSRWRFGGEHSDPELAVDVWSGTLSSGPGGGGPAGNHLRVGPAGNTLILSLRCRPGGEHSDPELAVEVWRGTL